MYYAKNSTLPHSVGVMKDDFDSDFSVEGSSPAAELTHPTTYTTVTTITTTTVTN